MFMEAKMISAGKSDLMKIGKTEDSVGALGRSIFRINTKKLNM